MRPRPQRGETRFPTNDSAEIIVLKAPFHQVPGRVRDVSRSGIRLELSIRLARGTRLEITLSTAIILGEVRYCRNIDSGFSVGILIRDLYLRAEVERSHIAQEELEFFALGKGLNSDQIIRIRQHLGNCEFCSQRLLEAIRFFQQIYDRKPFEIYGLPLP
jgi:PilZ domain-containing protein